MWSRLSVALLALLPVLGAAQGESKTFTGQATYNPFNNGLGACGYPVSDNDISVALDEKQFFTYMPPGGNSNYNPVCGKSITIKFGDNTQQAKIHDRCADCGGFGGLDLTRQLFDKLNPAGYVDGSFQVQWSFDDGEPKAVTVPSTAPVESQAATSAAVQQQSQAGPSATSGTQPAAEGVAEITGGNCVKGQQRCAGQTIEICDAVSNEGQGVYAFVPTGPCPGTCDASSGKAMCV